MEGVRITKVTRLEPEGLKINLGLVGAPDETDWRDPDYQSELAEAEQRLRANGISVQPRMYVQKSTTGGSWLTGDFLLYLVQLADAPLAAILTAWLVARVGRKVKIKVGDIEAEASTPAQVERLLEKAMAIQERLKDEHLTEKEDQQ